MSWLCLLPVLEFTSNGGSPLLWSICSPVYVVLYCIAYITPTSFLISIQKSWNGNTLKIKSLWSKKKIKKCTYFKAQEHHQRTEITIDFLKYLNGLQKKSTLTGFLRSVLMHFINIIHSCEMGFMLQWSIFWKEWDLI